MDSVCFRWLCLTCGPAVARRIRGLAFPLSSGEFRETVAVHAPNSVPEDGTRTRYNRYKDFYATESQWHRHQMLEHNFNFARSSYGDFYLYDDFGDRYNTLLWLTVGGKYRRAEFALPLRSVE